MERDVVSSQLLLDQIRADILEQNICPDLAKQAIQLVFGAGNPDADILFIGEAPGKKEDEQGLPFVGASGKLLNTLLETIGLDRTNVYITNIVKYRPPDNRDPSPQEKAAFLPYLDRQITVIDPKLIVTLGRHSMDVLLPGLIISQVHGSLITQNGRRYFPVYHPAATIYNRSLRQSLIDDFAKIPTIIS